LLTALKERYSQDDFDDYGSEPEGRYNDIKAISVGICASVSRDASVENCNHGTLPVFMVPSFSGMLLFCFGVPCDFELYNSLFHCFYVCIN